jgi:hypothetical protein
MTDADLENLFDAMSEHVMRVTADLPPRDAIEVAKRIAERAVHRQANINTNADAAEMARQFSVWSARLHGGIAGRS